eukprot:11041_3
MLEAVCMARRFRSPFSRRPACGQLLPPPRFGISHMRKKPRMWSIRYAWKYFCMCARRRRHQRQPSLCISSQLYGGKPQFCSGFPGAPALASLKFLASAHTSAEHLVTPIGMSPLRHTPLLSAYREAES